MSFSDRLLLWLHIGFAIFTIGPVTLAIMSTPRYIRQRNLEILRYLSRITLVFTIASLGVIVAGVLLGQLLHVAGKPWLIIAETLFVVSLALLLLLVRDQRTAIGALVAATDQAAHDAAAARAPAGHDAPATSGAASPAAAAAAPQDRAAPPAAGPAQGSGARRTPGAAPHLASVERGRIAMLGGVVVLIWLIILVLMIWR